MDALTRCQPFQDDYAKLKAVRLNPSRHAAPDAHAHCEWVAERVAALAAMNGCPAEETALLSDLARLHDIGKISGTANADASVELLERYGVDDPKLVNLVKYHDCNLPWYRAAMSGETPTDKAWRKLTGRVDLRLLCLFMVADRVDCPGGWRANAPLVWFLAEVERRALLPQPLVLDDGPEVALPAAAPELSAGALLVRQAEDGPEALLIRVRRQGFEVPKGHVEATERPVDTAARELREETGLLSPIRMGPELGTLSYAFERDGAPTDKRVHYYIATPLAAAALDFGPTPRGATLTWVGPAALPALPLVNEDLRPLVARALALGEGAGAGGGEG